jgi:hypothetical protein
MTHFNAFMKKICNKQIAFIFATILFIIIIGTNLYIYFIAYPHQQRIHLAGDPQALAATKISAYLNYLPPSYQTIFLTAPTLNIPYGPFDFLASSRVKIAIDNPDTYQIPQFLTKTVFVVYPQYEARLKDLQTLYPHGTMQTIKSDSGEVEYYLFMIN